MSHIRLNLIKIKNYRSFGEEQSFEFPNEEYKKPVAIVGYNNAGKTNLMNAILYGIGEKYVSGDSFEVKDLHDLKYENLIEIKTNLSASEYKVEGWNETKTIGGDHTATVVLEDGELKSQMKPSFFGANKHYSIFYVNFHKIKEEISTQKTSWGNLRSFLARHIKKIVDCDEAMKAKGCEFKSDIDTAKDKVLKDSSLNEFINKIKSNYSNNLRNNKCEVYFGLPDYEDIFLQMMFRIGLNGETENFIPIGHFGDGYISMFVMAVIQAIAENSAEDRCLFLFEEPESFLHENHQEYFYKMVLCQLADKGHQVIYTTHSDKMVDIFDTKGLIRIEFDEESKQTVKKYNDTGEFSPEESTNEITGGIVTLDRYNDFIRTIEPNLNKILFSKKVILVEGPNDVMAYKFAIERKIKELKQDAKYAETYLNFHNISIIAHHGKSTALYLIEICKYFDIDYFVINDWDFENDELPVGAIFDFDTLEELRADDVYSSSDKKAMITTNWNLINKAGKEKIHFNVPKLEKVIGYDSEDKNSLGIWNKLNEDGFVITCKLFPKELEDFLEFDKNLKNDEPEEIIINADDIPF